MGPYGASFFFVVVWGGGFKDLVGAYPYIKKLTPSNHPNPLINCPKVSIVQNRCTADPMVQSIVMGVKCKPYGSDVIQRGYTCVVHSDGPSAGPYYEVRIGAYKINILFF